MHGIAGGLRVLSCNHQIIPGVISSGFYRWKGTETGTELVHLLELGDMAEDKILSSVTSEMSNAGSTTWHAD